MFVGGLLSLSAELEFWWHGGIQLLVKLVLVDYKFTNGMDPNGHSAAKTLCQKFLVLKSGLVDPPQL